jgi:hypothetical protein
METDFYPALRARTRSAFLSFFALAMLLTSNTGCAIVGSRNDWNPPAPYSRNVLFGSTDPRFTSAEAHLAAGQRAEEACDPSCIDQYFAAATCAWPYHVECATAGETAATQLYQSAVRSFIASADHFSRFDRLRGIMLSNGQFIPVAYQNFVWQPADFCTFVPVGHYQSQRLTHGFANSGVGVPYVVLTTTPPRYPFTKAAQPFAATAVLAPNPALGNGFTLQFYDPLRANTTDAGLPITRDLTAPIAYAASQDSDAWLVDFLRPDRGDPLDGLHMREPFQPQKIPVVFVHGLASDESESLQHGAHRSQHGRAALEDASHQQRRHPLERRRHSANQHTRH